MTAEETKERGKMNCKRIEPVAVYICKCRVNGKKYVGSTTNIQRRITHHIWEARNENVNQAYPGKAKWYGDVARYGWEQFEWYVVESNIPHSQRQDREQYWISRYETTDQAKGYNKRREKALVVPVVYALPEE